MTNPIRRWWEGEYSPYENEPGSGIFLIGGTYRRHWTARVLRPVVAYVSEHHRWIITTALGVVTAIAVGLMRRGK